MTTATATAEKTVFKRETLELKNTMFTPKTTALTKRVALATVHTTMD